MAKGLLNSIMSIVTILLYRFHISWMGYIAGCLDLIFRLFDEASPIWTFALRQCLGWLNSRRNVSFLPPGFGVVSLCARLCLAKTEWDSGISYHSGLSLISPVRLLACRITQAPAAGDIACMHWSLLVWRPLSLVATLYPHPQFCNCHSQNCGLQ